MATVFFMKFNNEQGALAADEMTWHLSFKYGYRPTRYGDSILNLIDKNLSEKHNFAAVYAGVGFPSFHFETAEAARKIIRQNDDMRKDLDKVSKAVEDIYQDVHARMINDRLMFNFGFNRDQLNNGTYNFENKEWEINQESVIKEAKSILKNGVKDDSYVRIFNNEGIVMGYDKENGIRAYHIGNTGRGLDFAYPFDAIGPGKELGTKVFADTAYRMQLEERRTGFNFSDGLFLLLNSYVESYDFNMKTGGYSQLMLIDAKREVLPSITVEHNGHNLYLALEVIRAYRWGFINRPTAQNMMERLLLQNEEWESMEKELFSSASDPAMLQKSLMGFKPSKVPHMPLS